MTGCEASGKAGRQVGRTGAIRDLSPSEKRHPRMGLAIFPLETCLALTGQEVCQLYDNTGTAVGYDAIEFVLVS